MSNKIITVIIVAILLVIGLAIGGAVWQWIWNDLVVYLTGVKPLSFIQAVQLTILVALFAGSLRGK